MTMFFFAQIAWKATSPREKNSEKAIRRISVLKDTTEKISVPKIQNTHFLEKMTFRT